MLGCTPIKSYNYNNMSISARKFMSFWGVSKMIVPTNKKYNTRKLLCIFHVDPDTISWDWDGCKGFEWQGHRCSAGVVSTKINDLHDYGSIPTRSPWATDASHPVSPTTCCSIVPYAIADRSEMSIWRELILVVTIAFRCFINKANEIRWQMK